MAREETKLGLLGLTAIVIGGVIGGGIFNIPKVLAEGAALGAILISWVISGLGILGIALTFKMLNASRPDLSGGIYRYTRTGFGNFAGFTIAWGYWIGTALGNVVFSVMLNDAFGLFFPVLLEHGKATLIFASCCTWFFALLVALGLKLAAAINTISTIIKFSSLTLLVILLLCYADYGMLEWNFWGKGSHLGSLFQQVNSTLLTTLFFFMGVEGAIVVGARARRPQDIGKATVIGYLICLFLNVLVCVLAFGFISRDAMVHLNDPALAQIAGKGIGEWARIFVNISVIIAVAGAWLVSTIIAAELPAGAARDGIFPRVFARVDKRGTPLTAIGVTSVFIQVFLFVVILAHNVYVFSVDISGIMVLPTYVLSGLFLVKAALKKHIYASRPGARQAAVVTGILTVFYCLWIIGAGNVRLLFLSFGMYLIGIFFYRWAFRQHALAEKRPFQLTDRYVIVCMAVAWIFGIWWEWKGIG